MCVFGAWLQHSAVWNLPQPWLPLVQSFKVNQSEKLECSQVFPGHCTTQHMHIASHNPRNMSALSQDPSVHLIPHILLFSFVANPSFAPVGVIISGSQVLKQFLLIILFFTNNLGKGLSHKVSIKSNRDNPCEVVFSRELPDRWNTDSSLGISFYSSSSVAARLLIAWATMLVSLLVFKATAELGKEDGNRAS